MITTLLVQRLMGFGRERGIKEDLQFSGTSTWADGEGIHLYGGTWERNRSVSTWFDIEIIGDFNKKSFSGLVRAEFKLQRMKQWLEREEMTTAFVEKELRNQAGKGSRKIILELCVVSSEIFSFQWKILEYIYVDRKGPAEIEKWVRQRRKGITERGKSLSGWKGMWPRTETDHR